MAKHGTEWLDWQTALLVEHFPNKKSEELASLIGRDANSVHHKANKLKLKKSAEFLASPASGRIQESPIGTEYIHPNGYLIRKVNNDLPYSERLKAVHIIEWEDHYGLVPEGFIVSFKDGDKKNTNIENLELTTRKKLLQQNSIHRYPTMIGLIRLQRKLEREIKEREND